MKIYIQISILVIVLATSCNSNPDPIVQENKAEEITWQEEFISQKLTTIGSKIEQKIKEQKYLIVDSDSLEHYYYKAIAYKDKGYASSMDIDFYFSNDTLCKQGYEDFKNSFDNKFGNSSPSESMASWEAPSSRNKVVTVVLADRSAFFQQPRLQIKLKENDNRQFRKQ